MAYPFHPKMLETLILEKLVNIIVNRNNIICSHNKNVIVQKTKTIRLIYNQQNNA